MKKGKKHKSKKQGRMEQFVMGVLISVTAELILALIHKLFQ
ncbi:hypothetical protein P4H71_15340 [Paenibacillus kribbensis]|nr:hypothetical protein [Paenibacillus kribbensis]MEC0235703.1 hypothetical protein [Paenibacillus kribbensis]